MTLVFGSALWDILYDLTTTLLQVYKNTFLNKVIYSQIYVIFSYVLATYENYVTITLCLDLSIYCIFS